LLNYAHWGIVSPESSLAQVKGCDGYIAQVWTGTSRTPNLFRGDLRERTFETAFLEYGAMQNLVRATGRQVWYLNDPVEDNPNHDWEDYRLNWESTLVASLLQPEVWRYEVAPWPERVFAGKYPRRRGGEREPIPAPYATELQIVMNALNDMKQSRNDWDCGSRGFGVLIGDSLMFERGEPEGSDSHLSHIYGLALPLLKRGFPITPVQLENLTVSNYLAGFRVLLLTYQGQKPLSAQVHSALAAWVKLGGVLMVIDNDADPYNRVREWWNSNGLAYASPREHLFQTLGASAASFGADLKPIPCGKGALLWLQEDPARLAKSVEGDLRLVTMAKVAAGIAGVKWRECNYLVLRRGPYLIAAGLDESTASEPRQLKGNFINLFDPDLKVQDRVQLTPKSRNFLLDLTEARGRTPKVLASAGKNFALEQQSRRLVVMVEGVKGTPGIVLIATPRAPETVQLNGQPLPTYEYSSATGLLRVRFTNESEPRELRVTF
jgi:hypothetical protein